MILHESMYKQKLHKEQHNPSCYYVKESCIAIADYESLASRVKANTAAEFLTTLADKVEYAQHYCLSPVKITEEKQLMAAYTENSTIGLNTN